MTKINESMVSGDAGGDPEKIAKGEKSGNITSVVGHQSKPKKKKTLKELEEYLKSYLQSNE